VYVDFTAGLAMLGEVNVHGIESLILEVVNLVCTLVGTLKERR